MHMCVLGGYHILGPDDFYRGTDPVLYGILVHVRGFRMIGQHRTCDNLRSSWSQVVVYQWVSSYMESSEILEGRFVRLCLVVLMG